MVLPHQQRVMEEREQLVNRLAKLTAFFGTETFDGLPEDEQSALLHQARPMLDYLSVLTVRIRRFATNPNEE